MSSNRLGIGLILLGILVIAISALADTIGIGAEAGVFGWKQILGVVFGIVMLVAGLISIRRDNSTGDN